MIFYKKRRRYKYKLSEDYLHQAELRPAQPILTAYISLNTDGQLIIKQGYAWDGPSGITIDTDNFMRGSLVHDVLYQLMREKHLGQEHREYADGLLRDICREAGMSKIRDWWVYQAVRLGGASYAKPDVRQAP